MGVIRCGAWAGTVAGAALGAEETHIRAVDRYLAVPGQATSFMVGMRKFVAERERARLALEEKATAWIAAESALRTGSAVE